MKLNLKKLHPAATIPTYATDGAGNFDIHAFIEDDMNGESPMVLAPGQSLTIDTKLSFEVPEGWVMEIFSRSGHGFKNGVRLSNCVGQIDSDYRGEVKVALHNDRRAKFTIRHGDRIAQARLAPAPRVEFVETETLSDTTRGSGGFGSTGKK